LRVEEFHYDENMIVLLGKIVSLIEAKKLKDAQIRASERDDRYRGKITF